MEALRKKFRPSLGLFIWIAMNAFFIYRAYHSELLYNWFALIILLECGSIALAFSPLGEILLRLAYGVRPVIAQREIEKIMPIFDDLYSDLEQKTSNAVSNNIRLFIDNEATPNAYAVGSNTVVITKGAMSTMTPEEIKGMLSHEFAHLFYDDTKISLLLLIGNGIFSFGFLVLKLISAGLFKVSNFLSGGTGIVRDNVTVFLVTLPFSMLRAFCDLASNLYAFLISLLISIDSRQSEYRADEFSYRAGYGSGLIEALYTLSDLDYSKTNMFQKIMAGHPSIYKRIARLELKEKYD